MDNITGQLKNHDYQIKLDDNQRKLKQDVLNSLTNALRDGVDFDRDKVKTMIRRGIYDSTMFTLDFLKKARVQTQKASKYPDLPITKDQVQTNDSTRTYAIHSNHMVNFFRPNELRRWQYAANRYLELKSLGKIK